MQGVCRMTQARKFRRILLKISGEFLKDQATQSPVAPAETGQLAEQIGAAAESGVELALVIGAGNILRGLSASSAELTRVTADQMGMLATVINALAMRDALEARGTPARVLSAIPITGVTEPFDHRAARRHLAAGRVVLFAGGTGHPFFTTDTTAALRACEIGADAILKGTKVDGVYSADPEVDKTATRYERISFADALAQRLHVLDSTAFSLCMDNALPIVVFKFRETGSLGRVLGGDLSRATLVNDQPAIRG